MIVLVCTCIVYCVVECERRPVFFKTTTRRRGGFLVGMNGSSLGGVRGSIHEAWTRSTGGLDWIELVWTWMGRPWEEGTGRWGGGAVHNGVHFSVNVNYFEVWASLHRRTALHIINQFCETARRPLAVEAWVSSASQRLHTATTSNRDLDTSREVRPTQQPNLVAELGSRTWHQCSPDSSSG
jgi:hypothetical protein